MTAAGLAVLDSVQDKGFLDHVCKIGQYLAKAWDVWPTVTATVDCAGKGCFGD